MPVILNCYSREYSHFLAENVTKLEGFYGWLLSWIGAAIPIYDEHHNKTIYLRLQDIVASLCEMPLARISNKVLATSTDLQRLVLETLQPIIGKTPTWAKVDDLFRDFRTSEVLTKLQVGKESEAIETAAAKLEKLKTRDLHVLRFHHSNILNYLEPGDVLFKKLPFDSENTVVWAQRKFSCFQRGIQDRESYKYSHGLIYLGNGKFAEAAPDKNKKNEVRIFDWFDPKFYLPRGSKIQYLVARHTDPETAKNAAEIANEIVKNVSTGNANHTYTKKAAIRSIYTFRD